MESPIIDQSIFNEAKAMMRGKFPLMIDYFLEDAEMYFSAMQEAVGQKNFENIISPAHTLKSSSRQMGALRLSSISKEIEKLARDQSKQGCENMQSFIPLFSNLKKILIDTKEVLNQEKNNVQI